MGSTSDIQERTTQANCFALPKGRQVHLDRRVKVSDRRAELQASGRNVVEARQVQSMHQNPDTEKERPLKPLLIVSISLFRSVSKVSFISQLCGMHIKVEKRAIPRFLLQWKCFLPVGHTQQNCGYATGWLGYGNSHSAGVFSPHTANYRVSE
jgi:hypothetical protein